MRRKRAPRWPGLLLGLGLLGLPACSVYALYAIPAKTIQLRIPPPAADAERWSITVNDTPPVSVHPDADGRATLVLPPDRECHGIVLGFAVDAAGWRENARIRIERDGQHVCTLALAQLDDLPLDADGYRVLDLDT